MDKEVVKLRIIPQLRWARFYQREKALSHKKLIHATNLNFSVDLKEVDHVRIVAEAETNSVGSRFKHIFEAPELASFFGDEFFLQETDSMN